MIALLDAAIPMGEAKYFVGKRTILGLFPAAGDKVYAFYMIKTGSYDQVKAQGLSSLQNAWIAIDPSSEPIFRTLIDWKQTAFLPTGRVRTPTWVADGAVLVGDAAHAMNPHASQGRMQAMVDAMTLADLLPECLATNDYSAATLKRYEESRRPHVAMLQKLADEQVLFGTRPILSLVFFGTGSSAPWIATRASAIESYRRQRGFVRTLRSACWTA